MLSIPFVQALWRPGRPGVRAIRRLTAAAGVAGQGLPAAALGRRCSAGLLARPLAPRRPRGRTAGVGGANGGVRGGGAKRIDNNPVASLVLGDFFAFIQMLSRPGDLQMLKLDNYGFSD